VIWSCVVLYQYLAPPCHSLGALREILHPLPGEVGLKGLNYLVLVFVLFE